MPAVEFVREAREEVVVHPVVRIDNDDRLIGIEWLSRQVPGEEGTLSVWTVLPLHDLRTTRREVDRAIGAPIREHDDPHQLGRISLRLQVTEHVANDRLLIVGGNNDPEPPLPAAMRSGLLTGQTPQGRREGVEDERQHHELGCDRQCPYHCGEGTVIAHHTAPPKSIAVVLGTRPEIIKLGHVIRLLGDAAWVIHTGQHYDANLSASFFGELNLPEPDLYLGVGGTSRGHQIGDATQLLDAHFSEHRPLAVVVQGDTNAVAAGALAANAGGIPLVHVEAGLRSRDRNMPEEHNRIIADHLSDLCAAPTRVNVDNLAAEGIAGDRVLLTGNTIVEAVRSLLPADRQPLLERYEVTAGRFVLSTFHRPENVDDPERFSVILRHLAALSLPVLLPLHPRSVQRAAQFGLGSLLDMLMVTEPIGYRDFLGLSAESAMLVSDSGGVQEEVSIVKRPVLVVRNSTERPEVLGTFAERVLPGQDIVDVASRWLDDIPATHARLSSIPSPYGDGHASERIVHAIDELVGRE